MEAKNLLSPSPLGRPGTQAKRKANIFENCTCQQVNKAKNIGDKQRSP